MKDFQRKLERLRRLDALAAKYQAEGETLDEAYKHAFSDMIKGGAKK